MLWNNPRGGCGHGVQVCPALHEYNASDTSTTAWVVKLPRTDGSKLPRVEAVFDSLSDTLLRSQEFSSWLPPRRGSCHRKILHNNRKLNSLPTEKQKDSINLPLHTWSIKVAQHEFPLTLSWHFPPIGFPRSPVGLRLWQFPFSSSLLVILIRI